MSWTKGCKERLSRTQAYPLRRQASSAQAKQRAKRDPWTSDLSDLQSKELSYYILATRTGRVSRMPFDLYRQTETESRVGKETHHDDYGLRYSSGTVCNGGMRPLNSVFLVHAEFFAFACPALCCPAGDSSPIKRRPYARRSNRNNCTGQLATADAVTIRPAIIVRVVVETRPVLPLCWSSEGSTGFLRQLPMPLCAERSADYSARNNYVIITPIQKA